MPSQYLWQDYLSKHPNVVVTGKRLAGYMNADEVSQFQMLEGRFFQLMAMWWPWSYNAADMETEVQTWAATVDMGTRFLIYAAAGDQGFSGRNVTIDIILPSMLQEPTSPDKVTTYFAALQYFQNLRTTVLSRVKVSLGAVPTPTQPDMPAATTPSVVNQPAVNQNSGGSTLPVSNLVTPIPTNTGATATPVIQKQSDQLTSELVMGIFVSIIVAFLLSRS